MPPSLIPYLSRFRRRLRLRDGWRWLQRSAWIPALGALLIQLIGRLLPVERLDLWSLAPFVAWLLGVLAYAAFYPAPAMRVARRVDLELGLRERLSTALAFTPHPHSHSPTVENGLVGEGFPYANPRLLAVQYADALQAAESVEPRRDLPFNWLPRPLLLALGLIVLAAVSAYLPNAMDITLAERRAVREEAARQAERVEQLRQQIEQAQELSPEEREELLRRLAELAEQLRANRGDLEQAMADISNVEKALEARQDPNAAAQAANLEALAERLSALANRPRDPNSSAAQAASDALAALAEQMDRLSPEQQQALAQQLAQAAAQAAQSGDQALAQALASLGQAAQSGDSQAASTAAQSVEAALAQTEARLTDQEALEAAIARLQQGRQSLAQAAQAAVAAAQSGQMGQSAMAGQPGQANQPGQSGQSGQSGQQGQNPGQGQGVGPGGGSNASTLPPAQGGRTNVRPRGDAPLTEAGQIAGQVYSPWQRPAPGGEQLFIPGQETGQGETQTSQGQSNLPGASNPALVPYSQVYYNYFTAASQAIQTGHIPSSLSSYVKNYFTQLAPR
jgi:septal ring factor EnvC (AmiA/AmiB activator)